MERSQYPVFQGKIVSVSAVLEDDNGVYSIVDYFLSGEEPDEKEIRAGFFQELLNSVGKNEGVPAPSELEKKIKRVVVPMRLDAYVLNEAEVIARFGWIRSGDQKKDCYEIEVIKGRLESSGIFPVEIHTGFKYIKVFD